mmetsp:Transcript_6627/g.16264  ORF Transcript_6627/g.16264 Transcript_6627/m.16264 type:complete len:257 (-) Transcript_6627:39-809(-)
MGHNLPAPRRMHTIPCPPIRRLLLVHQGLAGSTPLGAAGVWIASSRDQGHIATLGLRGVPPRDRLITTAHSSSSPSASSSWKLSARLGHRHLRWLHACFFTPGPPNLGLSLQLMHSPQSGLRQFAQVPHLEERILLLIFSSSSSALQRFVPRRLRGARTARLALLSTNSALAAAFPDGLSGPFRSKSRMRGSAAKPSLPGRCRGESIGSCGAFAGVRDGVISSVSGIVGECSQVVCLRNPAGGGDLSCSRTCGSIS